MSSPVSPPPPLAASLSLLSVSRETTHPHTNQRSANEIFSPPFSGTTQPPLKNTQRHLELNAKARSFSLAPRPPPASISPDQSPSTTPSMPRMSNEKRTPPPQRKYIGGRVIFPPTRYPASNQDSTSLLPPPTSTTMLPPHLALIWEGIIKQHHFRRSPTNAIFLSTSYSPFSKYEREF